MLRASQDLKAWQTIGNAPKADFSSFSVDEREETAIVPPSGEHMAVAGEVKPLDSRQESPADTTKVDQQAKRKLIAALAPVPQCVASRRITEKIMQDQAKASNYKLHKLHIKHEIQAKRSLEPSKGNSKAIDLKKFKVKAKQA